MATTEAGGGVPVGVLSDEDLARIIWTAVRDEPGYLSAARIARREIAAAGYQLVEARCMSVPESLRERLTNRVRQYRYDGSETTWDMADAILAEIAAAGFELVETGRMDRLRGVVRGAHRMLNKPGEIGRSNGYTLLVDAVDKLQPGDLDGGR
jgi:hypothetical protein